MGSCSSLAPWSVRSSFMSGWCCVELVESTAVDFELVLLLSNGQNFHGAMASTLVIRQLAWY